MMWIFLLYCICVYGYINTILKFGIRILKSIASRFKGADIISGRREMKENWKKTRMHNYCLKGWGLRLQAGKNQSYLSLKNFCIKSRKSINKYKLLKCEYSKQKDIIQVHVIEIETFFYVKFFTLNKVFLSKCLSRL